MKYLLILLWLIPSSISIEKLTLLDNHLGWLTANIFYEARNQGRIGMEIVRDVTLNRVEASKGKDSISTIVSKPKQFSWTHQRPWGEIQERIKGSTSGLNKLDILAYQRAYLIASEGLYGASRAIPKGVIYYHTDKVDPSWNKELKKYKKVGDHILYYGKRG